MRCEGQRRQAGSVCDARTSTLPSNKRRCVRRNEPRSAVHWPPVKRTSAAAVMTPAGMPMRSSDLFFGAGAAHDVLSNHLRIVAVGIAILISWSA